MSTTERSAHEYAALADAGSSASVVVRSFEEALGAAEALLVYRSDPAVEIRSRPATGEPGAAEYDYLRDRFMLRLHGIDKAIFEVVRGDNGASKEDPWYAVGASFLTPDGVAGAIGARIAEPPTEALQSCVAIARSYAGTAALCPNPLDGISLALGASRIDPLTQCLQLWAMIEAIEAEIARSERLGHDLSCVFLDLDGFKAVNESEGHLAGNRVLARAGDLLTTGARRYDLVARFGGDEFLVLLPETRLEEAERLASRLCNRLSSGLAELTDLEITSSAGVAAWTNGRRAEQMIEAADSTMRQAKAGGGSWVLVEAESVSDRDAEPVHAATEIIAERYAQARQPDEEEIKELMLRHEITEAEAILLTAGKLQGRRPTPPA